VHRPLLDVRVFRYWAFTNSLLIIAVLSIGLFGVLFYVPMVLQHAQGLGAFHTGLVLLPQALVMAVLMPVAGRLYDRIGPRWPAVVGLLIVALGTYELHGLTPDTPRSHTIALLSFRAVGMGLAMMPIMTAGIAAVPIDMVSRASAFNNVAQRTSAALGLAMLTALLARQQAQQLVDRSALLPPDTVTGIGPPATSPVVVLYGVYQELSRRVFVAAVDDLFLVTAVMTLLAVVLAVPMRSNLASLIGRRAPALTSVEPAPVGASGSIHERAVTSTGPIERVDDSVPVGAPRW
jgi:MFS family permease